uniref:28S ribosomal protein S24, mitochondrial n=1 Tax=Ascaris lumbricoides TaxID=6252 RepID=A0A0M3IG83_ASCLU
MTTTQVRGMLSPSCSTIIPESLRRYISFGVVLRKNQAGKYQATIDRSQMLTYEMAQRPHHIGVKKAWLTWHSQNLEQFRQTQPYQVAQDEIIRRCIRGFFAQYLTVSGNEVAQDEIIRRCIRGFFAQYLTVSGNELVIKRRGNCVYVAGFLQYSRRLDVRRIYWMFGFAEEFLSILLKQPVKLELQFVPSEETLAYNYI